MIYEINFFINNSSFKISNVSPLLLKFNQISPSLSLFPEYSVPPPFRGAPLWLATPLVDERVHS